MSTRTYAQFNVHIPEIPRGVLIRMAQIVGSLAAWALAFFASAGQLDYPRAWIYLSLCLCTVAISAVLVIRRNPELLVARSRLRADAKAFDKIFAALYTVLLFFVPVVAGLDAVRFGWSSMSFETVYPGVLLHLLASTPVVAAMIENPYLECLVRIQHDRDQHVIATGPYSIVRHPMYVGCIVQNVATPLILGSWWAYVPSALIIVLFIWRTALEDRTLRKELPGYEEFTHRTRYRLLPGVW